MLRFPFRRLRLIDLPTVSGKKMLLAEFNINKYVLLACLMWRSGEAARSAWCQSQLRGGGHSARSAAQPGQECSSGSALSYLPPHSQGQSQLCVALRLLSSRCQFDDVFFLGDFGFGDRTIATTGQVVNELPLPSSVGDLWLCLETEDPGFTVNVVENTMAAVRLSIRSSQACPQA